MVTTPRATATRLEGCDGYEPFGVEVTQLPNGRQLLLGCFRDFGPKRRSPRAFRILIHTGFEHRELGCYLWQELNLQIRYALRYYAGDIDIVVPWTDEEGNAAAKSG
jgi:hypothetical protein